MQHFGQLRKILIICTILGLVIFKASSLHAQDKEIFIKEFQFELKEISDNQYENEYFLTITLNKNSLYKFTVLNHIGDFPGKAIVQILEGEKVLASNDFNGKYYEKFVFKCNKTGFYDILIHFDDNKKGILSSNYFS